MSTIAFRDRVANSERVSIEKLNIGDVVLSDGMAVEIVDGPHVYEQGDVYAYDGRIVNADELRDETGKFRWPYVGIVTESLRWTVQRRRGIAVIRQARED